VPTPVDVLKGAGLPEGITCSPIRGGTPVGHWLFGCRRCCLGEPSAAVAHVRGVETEAEAVLSLGRALRRGDVCTGNVAGNAACISNDEPKGATCL
jgi:hypothetical protein